MKIKDYSYLRFLVLQLSAFNNAYAMANNSIKYLVSKIISTVILIAFIITSVIPPSYAQMLNLPTPGQIVPLSVPFNPTIIKGLKFYANDPLRFDFIVFPHQESGLTDMNENNENVKAQAMTLIKYFLTTLTIPEDDTWVNLSPYEKNRVIPSAFGKTEMGRDLLAQDYLLKQVTSSLMYPENKLGKKFWDKIYHDAYEKFGTTDIPIDTFNKVWIVPNKAVVYEGNNVAYVVESSLKVMLEEDYLAMNKGLRTNDEGHVRNDRLSAAHHLSSMIIKQIIIPKLEQEVNSGKNFAKLRQVYNSLILATWFKRKLKNNLVNKFYSNKNKINGIENEDKDIGEKIYTEYLKAFKLGAYNYIKEDYDPIKQEIIPRKYFSGGMSLLKDLAMQTVHTIDRSKINKAGSQVFKVVLDPKYDAAMMGDKTAKNETKEKKDNPLWKLKIKTRRKLLENVLILTGDDRKFTSNIIGYKDIYFVNKLIKEKKIDIVKVTHKRLLKSNPFEETDLPSLEVISNKLKLGVTSLEDSVAQFKLKLVQYSLKRSGGIKKYAAKKLNISASKLNAILEKRSSWKTNYTAVTDVENIGDINENVKQFEKKLIEKVLVHTHGRLEQTANILDIIKPILADKIKEYNINLNQIARAEEHENFLPFFEYFSDNLEIFMAKFALNLYGWDVGKAGAALGFKNRKSSSKKFSKLGINIEKGKNNYREQKAAFIKRIFTEALKETGGNVTLASHLLGFKSVSSFHQYRRKYNITFDKEAIIPVNQYSETYYNDLDDLSTPEQKYLIRTLLILMKGNAKHVSEILGIPFGSTDHIIKKQLNIDPNTYKPKRAGLKGTKIRLFQEELSNFEKIEIARSIRSLSQKYGQDFLEFLKDEYIEKIQKQDEKTIKRIFDLIAEKEILNQTSQIFKIIILPTLRRLKPYHPYDFKGIRDQFAQTFQIGMHQAGKEGLKNHPTKPASYDADHAMANELYIDSITFDLGKIHDFIIKNGVTSNIGSAVFRKIRYRLTEPIMKTIETLNYEIKYKIHNISQITKFTQTVAKNLCDFIKDIILEDINSNSLDSDFSGKSLTFDLFLKATDNDFEIKLVFDKAKNDPQHYYDRLNMFLNERHAEPNEDISSEPEEKSTYSLLIDRIHLKKFFQKELLTDLRTTSWETISRKFGYAIIKDAAITEDTLFPDIRRYHLEFNGKHLKYQPKISKKFYMDGIKDDIEILVHKKQHLICIEAFKPHIPSFHGANINPRIYALLLRHILKEFPGYYLIASDHLELNETLFSLLDFQSTLSSDKNKINNFPKFSELDQSDLTDRQKDMLELRMLTSSFKGIIPLDTKTISSREKDASMTTNSFNENVFSYEYIKKISNLIKNNNLITEAGEKIEFLLIQKALFLARGNTKAAAELLGITTRLAQNKILHFRSILMKYPSSSKFYRYTFPKNFNLTNAKQTFKDYFITKALNSLPGGPQTLIDTLQISELTFSRHINERAQFKNYLINSVAQSVQIQPLKSAMNEFENKLILQALILSFWRVSSAAKLLGLNRKALATKIRKKELFSKVTDLGLKKYILSKPYNNSVSDIKRKIALAMLELYSGNATHTGRILKISDGGNSSHIFFKSLGIDVNTLKKLRTSYGDPYSRKPPKAENIKKALQKLAEKYGINKMYLMQKIIEIASGDIRMLRFISDKIISHELLSILTKRPASRSKKDIPLKESLLKLNSINAEKKLIAWALKSTKGNTKLAAELLTLQEASFLTKINRYKIDPSRYLPKTNKKTDLLFKNIDLKKSISRMKNVLSKKVSLPEESINIRIKSFERALIVSALKHTDGIISLAADLLGVSPSYISRRTKKYKIDYKAFRWKARVSRYKVDLNEIVNSINKAFLKESLILLNFNVTDTGKALSIGTSRAAPSYLVNKMGIDPKKLKEVYTSKLSMYPKTRHKIILIKELCDKYGAEMRVLITKQAEIDKLSRKVFKYIGKIITKTELEKEIHKVDPNFKYTKVRMPNTKKEHSANEKTTLKSSVKNELNADTSVSPSEKDPAMIANKATKGGIDLSTKNLDIKIRGKGEDFNIQNINIEELKNDNFQGFTPVILEVIPLTNLPMFLGLNTNENRPEDTSKAPLVISRL